MGGAVASRPEESYDLVISYATSDKALAFSLAQRFEAMNLRVWWDINLQAGDEIGEVVRAQITNAKAVIVIWSLNSVTSKWVRAEATLAKKLNKLVPLRTADCSEYDVPLPHIVDRSESYDDFERLLICLRSLGILPSGFVELGQQVLVECPRELMQNPLNAPMFQPGGGLTEWFQDVPFGPQLVVVPPLSKNCDLRPFAVGRYPVSFEEWDAARAEGLVSARPEDEWGRERYPVINVSWIDAETYVRRLSEYTRKPYRLLSEAEWIHCCLAGGQGPYATGATITPLDAWFARTHFDTPGRTAMLGDRARPANAFGLFDMHGNVWEWSNTVCPTSEQTARRKSALYVAKGGSWNSTADDLAVNVRLGFPADVGRNFIGFRVLRELW